VLEEELPGVEETAQELVHKLAGRTGAEKGVVDAGMS